MSRWDKSQVVEMSVVEMSVALTSVGQKSRHPYKTINKYHFLIYPNKFKKKIFHSAVSLKPFNESVLVEVCLKRKENYATDVT